MINALTIDVEEYFHPSEVQPHVARTDWHTFPSRIDLQTNRILDLLDRHNVCATFFVLGWVAEHHPELIRRIAVRGHEIACHSYEHELVYRLTPKQFEEDTRRAVAAIQDACGVTPIAYRAPSYSIIEQSMWALDILVQLGFQYDSSIYPVKHDRYGIPAFSRFPVMHQTPCGQILEIPIATAAVGKKGVAPVGGGGYLRLLPVRYTIAGLRRVNEQEMSPACVYFHPWEIDAEQPRLAAGFISRLRTYRGLAGMEAKLDKLLRTFQFSTLSSVYGDLHIPARRAVSNVAGRPS